MENIKQKTIEFKDVSSSDDFLFQICNRLKMKGWQFDNLTIEEKVLKWSSRNINKELIIEIFHDSIKKKINEVQSRNTLTSKTEIPKGYEIGNPHNRWIHNDGIIRTQEQINEDEKKIKIQSEKEYIKIEGILDSINKKCQIEIIRK